MDEDKFGKWTNVDKDAVTFHHYTDSEIMHTVVSPQQLTSGGESSDENEEDVTNRLIQLTGEPLKGLEQQTEYFTSCRIN